MQGQLVRIKVCHFQNLSINITTTGRCFKYTPTFSLPFSLTHTYHSLPSILKMQRTLVRIKACQFQNLLINITPTSLLFLNMRILQRMPIIILEMSIYILYFIFSCSDVQFKHMNSTLDAPNKGLSRFQWLGIIKARTSLTNLTLHTDECVHACVDTLKRKHPYFNANKLLSEHVCIMH